MTRIPVHLTRLIWALAMLALVGVASAKSYHLTRVEQDVYLQADGLVRVVDTRTFQFEGTYRTAFFEIEPRRGGQVQFGEAVALDGQPVVASVTGNRLSLTGGPKDAAGELPPLATDTSRTFRFSYTLSRELDVASDAAQFDRQVLEPVHPRVDRYVLRLHAPKPVPERFRVFIFTPQGSIGDLKFDEQKQVVTATLGPLAADTFLRSRVILAARPFAARTISEPRFAQWLKETAAETQQFREQSRRQIENQGGGPPAPPAPPPKPLPLWLDLLPIGVLLVLVVGLVRDHRRFGREPPVEAVGPYYREPPEQLPPGLVPYVLEQSDPGKAALGPALSATLLGLARAGSLELARHQEAGPFGLFGIDETRFRLVRAPDGASGFESRIYGLLREADSGDGTVSPAELRAHFLANKGLAATLAALPRAEYEAAHGPLLDPGSDARSVSWAISLFLVSVLCLGAAFFLGGASLLSAFTDGGLRLGTPGLIWLLVGLTGLALMVLAFVAGLALPRWNADKLLNARRWAAYREFLSDFSQMETAPAEHVKLWDYHFVYAAALGVAERYLAGLRNLIDAGRVPDTVLPAWAGGHTPGQLSSLSDLSRSTGDIGQLTGSLGSLEQVSRNLGSLNSALDSSSSSSGSGGGFSSGPSGSSSGGGSSSGAS